jgi:hypothetical protein
MVATAALQLGMLEGVDLLKLGQRFARPSSNLSVVRDPRRRVSFFRLSPAYKQSHLSLSLARSLTLCRPPAWVIPRSGLARARCLPARTQQICSAGLQELSSQREKLKAFSHEK